ncbi:hypothetical protein ABPG75_006977 [Micractinium tetrahymenae]
MQSLQAGAHSRPALSQSLAAAGAGAHPEPAAPAAAGVVRPAAGGMLDPALQDRLRERIEIAKAQIRQQLSPMFRLSEALLGAEQDPQRAADALDAATGVSANGFELLARRPGSRGGSAGAGGGGGGGTAAGAKRQQQGFELGEAGGRPGSAAAKEGRQPREGVEAMQHHSTALAARGSTAAASAILGSTEEVDSLVANARAAAARAQVDARAWVEQLRQRSEDLIRSECERLVESMHLLFDGMLDGLQQEMRGLDAEGSRQDDGGSTRSAAVPSGSLNSSSGGSEAEGGSWQSAEEQEQQLEQQGREQGTEEEQAPLCGENDGSDGSDCASAAFQFAPQGRQPEGHQVLQPGSQTADESPPEHQQRQQHQHQHQQPVTPALGASCWAGCMDNVPPPTGLDPYLTARSVAAPASCDSSAVSDAFDSPHSPAAGSEGASSSGGGTSGGGGLFGGSAALGHGSPGRGAAARRPMVHDASATPLLGAGGKDLDSIVGSIRRLAAEMRLKQGLLAMPPAGSLGVREAGSLQGGGPNPLVHDTPSAASKPLFTPAGSSKGASGSLHTGALYTAASSGPGSSSAAALRKSPR